MEPKKLINFRMTEKEVESIEDLAKEKGFQDKSSFLRCLVRLFAQKVPENKNGIYSG